MTPRNPSSGVVGRHIGRPRPTPEQTLACRVCGTIPPSVQQSAEGREYLEHFCAPHCQPKQ